MQLELVRNTPNMGFHLPLYGHACNSNNVCITFCDGVALALKYNEGVLLATARPATENYETIYKLTDKICACVYGYIGDIQQIMKMAISQIKLLEYNTEHAVTVRAVTHNFRNLLRSLPKAATACQINAEIIVGGVDCDGDSISHIFSETFNYCTDDYCLTGDKDGLILLDKFYNKNLTEETALQLAIDVMKMKHNKERKIKCCIINSQGIREITNELDNENKFENVVVFSPDFYRDFVLFNKKYIPVQPFRPFKREILSSRRGQPGIAPMAPGSPMSPRSSVPRSSSIDEEKPSTSKAAQMSVIVSRSKAFTERSSDISNDSDFD